MYMYIIKPCDELQLYLDSLGHLYEFKGALLSHHDAYLFMFKSRTRSFWCMFV